MDFWEGFFLGKYWTDSNFEDKPRKSFFLTIGFVIFLFCAVNFMYPKPVEKFFLMPFWLHLLLGFILLVSLPFAAAHYHKLNFFVKLLVLLGYLLQYIFLIFGFVQIISGQVGLDTESVPAFFLNMFDRVMSLSGELFTFLGGLGSTIASVLGGIIIGGSIIVLILFVAIFIPLIYIILFRALQRLIDKTIYNKWYSVKI
ncbi:MAG TPA: hypothetical protein GXZ76_07230 [Clostridiaceae bacterium]|jgi:hypothetical protein|nr:hypothetical protein [Clostridiaceae bacterium]